MDQKTYMTSRIDDQIAWYDRRSGDYQKQYKRYRIAEIFCASLIPFLTGFVDKHVFFQITIGLLGVVIAIVSAMDALIRPQQMWTEYRATAEKLKQEKYRFETATAPYNGKDSFQQFVENAEGILAGESSRWVGNQSKQEKERQQPQGAQLQRPLNQQRKPKEPSVSSDGEMRI